MEDDFIMRDLRFYNTPIDKPGIAGFFVTFARRSARKLLLPFFARLVEILDALARHHDQSDQDRTALHAAVHYVDAKADAINRKFDLLNSKFDELNLKMETLRTEFGELRQREDALREEFAAVIALNWDHVAIGRRPRAARGSHAQRQYRRRGRRPASGIRPRPIDHLPRSRGVSSDAPADRAVRGSLANWWQRQNKSRSASSHSACGAQRRTRLKRTAFPDWSTSSSATRSCSCSRVGGGSATHRSISSRPEGRAKSSDCNVSVSPRLRAVAPRRSR